MPGTDATKRRRELEHRAYAPGGSLTDAEAQELRELSIRHVVAPAPAPSTPAPAGPTPLKAESVGAPEALLLREPDDPAQDSSSERDGRSERPRRARRLLVPILAILLVLAGLAVGRVAFGQPGDPAMGAQQQDAWAKIEASGEYDPGSVQLLGSKYGVDVWSATKQDQKIECVLLTRGEGPSAGCRSGAQEDQGLDLQVSLDYSEGDDDYMVWVNVTDDITGAPAVMFQRDSMTEEWDWRATFDDDELAIIEELEAAGFAGDGLSIVGYDAGVAVWLYQREKTCVLAPIDGAVLQNCGELLADSDRPLALTVEGTEYQVRASSNEGNTLTIVRPSAGQNAAEG
ncbi:hypothetical protein ACFWHT_03485 [Microbacterium sp. NPDC058342]|uniref:hypothetical protein n=1 Tax=Microbacterium sp. NPDC058342 TaxID=3346454 RepID=UPI0036675167